MGNERKEIEKFIDAEKTKTEQRKKNFDELFDFVLSGKQWLSAELRERDADDAPSLVFNFCEDYLNRYMARLFPRSSRTGVMEIGVKVYNDNNGKMNDEILSVYRRNYLPAILLEQSVDFLVGGDACFFYPQDEITKTAKIISLDPRRVYLGWAAGQLQRVAYKIDFEKNKSRIYYCDRDFIITLHESGKEIISKNEFDFIPFSWIPNTPKPHSIEGISRVNSLIDLDRAYNFSMSDYAKRVEENTDPHLVLFSDEAKIDDFTRGRKKKSQAGKDDDARYLTLGEGPEVTDFADIIDQKMRRKTGLVDSGGSIKSVVSGLSLSFQYSDMNDMIGFMRVYWDKAFRELNNAILNYKFGQKEYETDPVYNPSILFDSKQRVEEYDIMLRNHIISRRDAIDELRGVENVDDKIKEIIEEEKIFQQFGPTKEAAPFSKEPKV